MNKKLLIGILLSIILIFIATFVLLNNNKLQESTTSKTNIEVTSVGCFATGTKSSTGKDIDEVRFYVWNHGESIEVQIQYYRDSKLVTESPAFVEHGSGKSGEQYLRLLTTYDYETYQLYIDGILVWDKGIITEP